MSSAVSAFVNPIQSAFAALTGRVAETQMPKAAQAEAKKVAPTTTDAQRRRKAMRSIANRTGGRSSTFLSDGDSQLG